jgi:hypothetical protein
MHIRMKQWYNAVNWFKTSPLPKRVYHKDIVSGYGQSKLTPAGPVRERAIEELPKVQRKKVVDGRIA